MLPLDVENVQKAIGYRFSREQLLCQAFVHSSFGNAECLPDNERMEFLGDSVLGLVVSEFLYLKFPQFDDGKLSKAKSAIVSAEGLKPIVQQLGILRYLSVAVGADNIKKKSKKIEANLYEAVVGAIYLDGGWENAKSFVLRTLTNVLNNFSLTDIHDYKTPLQEYCQQNKKEIKYVFESKVGSDNNPTFNYSLYVGGKKVSQGTGASKKAAEQDAARKIVEKWRIE